MKNFRDWRLFNKIVLIGSASIFFFMLVIGVFILPKVESYLTAEKIDGLKNLIDLATVTLTRIEDQIQSGTLKLEGAQARAKTEIRALSYTEDILSSQLRTFIYGAMRPHHPWLDLYSRASN